MNKKHLRGLIAETISEIAMHSDDAEELLMLTCAVESEFGRNLVQLNNGPAIGIFQMEPATHDDIVVRWLSVETSDRMKTKAYVHKAFNKYCGTLLTSDVMRWNLKYAIILARLKYKSAKEPIPSKNDVVGLAKYWKKYWNTELGDGTVEKAIEKYNKYVLG